MSIKKVLIIGEVFVDTHINLNADDRHLVRLGGIFHSARSFCAIGIPYVLAYFAPNYLEKDIKYYASILKATNTIKLGEVLKSPNVMIIQEAKEVGDQGYINVLKDQAEILENDTIKEDITREKPSDILIFPGRYDCKNILLALSDFPGNIHIDFHYDYEKIIDIVPDNISSLIFSTSSTFLKGKNDLSINEIIALYEKYSKSKLLVKENRGGSYCFDFLKKHFYESGSYHVRTIHSVGVGDCYNSVFISSIFDDNLLNMKLASIISGIYASTFSFDNFLYNVNQVLQNKEIFLSLKLDRVSSDEKKKHLIYLAAPDFPYVNTKLLDELDNCLKYHGFITKRPIKENGLISASSSEMEKKSIYFKDIDLLKKCDLLIATLLFIDPGTLVEIGLFKKQGMPVIIFDPYSLCNNNFLINTADYICNSIEEVLEAVYNNYRRLI